MKQILISIKPEWVAKILSGEKTLEIRKTAPKCKRPIDVYIYCTKSHKSGWCMVGKGDNKSCFASSDRNDLYNVNRHYVANGYVVAKFTLKTFHRIIFIDKYTRENSCLTNSEIIEYMMDSNAIYAWHIKDLEIFDEPKELSEFKLTRAPQSWCYVEEIK